MSTLTVDLQAALKELDPDSATKLERLVRDAMALAQQSKAKPMEVDAKGWPVGYWEKFAGCLAGEQWDLPDDPPPEPPPGMVMRYLLDSNILIFALKDLQCVAANRLKVTDVTDIAICSIVEAELYHGARKYGNPFKRKATLDELLAPYISLPFDSACVPQYARISDHLERQGSRIGGHDLLIAAIALTHDLTVVTHDGDDFTAFPTYASKTGLCNAEGEAWDLAAMWVLAARPTLFPLYGWRLYSVFRPRNQNTVYFAGS